MKMVCYSEPFEIIVCPDFGFDVLLHFGRYDKCHELITKKDFPLLRRNLVLEVRLARPDLMRHGAFVEELAADGFEPYPIDVLLSYGLEPETGKRPVAALGSWYPVEEGYTLCPCLHTLPRSGRVLDLWPLAPEVGTRECEYLVGPPINQAPHTDIIPKGLVPATATLPLNFLHAGYCAPKEAA